MTSPAITVLMPVYNGAAYLHACIDSVLAQSRRDFEFLIIDDGSTDESNAIVAGYAQRDPRVRLVTQPNKGISATLNAGLELASAPLIARMDSDDIMMPTRLEAQAAFLETNPAIGFCASAMEVIDRHGQTCFTFRPEPATLAELEAMYLRRAPITFTHPTVMARRAPLLAVGGYDRRFEPAEDMELFGRLMNAGHPGIALPQILMRYRMHSDSISGSKVLRQAITAELVRRNFYSVREGGPVIPPEQWPDHIAQLPPLRRALFKAKMRQQAMRQSARYDAAGGRPIRAAAKAGLVALVGATAGLARMGRR